MNMYINKLYLNIRYKPQYPKNSSIYFLLIILEKEKELILIAKLAK